MYKQAQIKDIKIKNKKVKIQYREIYIEKSKKMQANIENYFNLFWKFVYFINEVYFNLSKKINERIL